MGQIFGLPGKTRFLHDSEQSAIGRFVPGDEDDTDTPNTQAFLCKWADHEVLVTFEFRH